LSCVEFCKCVLFYFCFFCIFFQECRRKILRYHIYWSHGLWVKGIQITATTPTNNAVRFETGVIELELSNRVQGVALVTHPAPSLHAAPGLTPKNAPLKVFVRSVVDLNLALGTLLKNPMFEEAESEFQHLASFQTRITLRNALQVYRPMLLLVLHGLVIVMT